MNETITRGGRPSRLFARLLGGAVAVVVAAALVWWLQRDTGENLEDLLTAEVGRGDIENTVTALGNLQPRNYVDVGAQVSGQLKKLHVEIGDTVQQGDLVAEIDATVLSARVESTRAQLTAQRAQLVDREAQVLLANDKYQRQVQLKAEDATSEEAFQSAKAALDSAKAQLDVLRAQIQQTESGLKGDSATLGYSRIFAPIAGTVVSITAREGQTLNANQVAPIILRIADLSSMTVWTQVSEADVPKLQEGMDAYFSTLGNPDRRWRGTLHQILPTPELVNNVVLYTALFDVDNPDGELKTQMSAQVFFVVGSAREVVTVPVAALHAYVPPEAAASTTAENTAPPAEGTAQAGERPRVPRPEAMGEGAPDREALRGLRQGMREGGQGMRAGMMGRQRGDSARPRVQAVTVVDAEGNLSERRVVVGVTNRVLAQVIEGLEPGEIVVSGKKAAPPPQTGPQQRGPGGGPGGGFRGFP